MADTGGLTAPDPPRLRRRSEWEPIGRLHHRWALGEEVEAHPRNVLMCVAQMFSSRIVLKNTQHGVYSVLQMLVH